MSDQRDQRDQRDERDQIARLTAALDDLHARLDAAEARAADLSADALKALDVAHDLAGKLQFLINWIDAQGLLPEHIYTFPDGDVWKAKR